LNGGVNDPANPSTISTKKNIKLKNATRTGYTFGGWYQDENFKTKKVTTIKKGTKKNIVLYAKWTPNNYTIKFKGKGTSGSMSPMKMTYDTAAELKPLTLKKKGYSFKNWNTKLDGTGETFADKATVLNLVAAKGKSITLYAQWDIDTYSISYELDGGTNSTENPATYQVIDKTRKLRNPVKAGYIFNGWYKKIENGKYKGKISQITKGSAGNLTLYAKWTEKIYTIKFNGNKATSGAMLSMAFVSAAKEVELSGNIFEKEGYKFVGWNTKANGKGVSIPDKAVLYNPEFVKKNGQTITLYAQWEKVE
jgi:uncharacterized repeat protein (TIGR02543 family)